LRIKVDEQDTSGFPRKFNGKGDSKAGFTYTTLLNTQRYCFHTDTITPLLYIVWNTLGKATDKAFIVVIVVYDDESKRIVYADDIDRSVGTVTLDASVFADVSSYGEIYAYLAFYTIAADGSGMNSETTVLKATKV
jgi:hypothetical protein